MSKPVTMAVIGAGGRGTGAYAPYSLKFADRLNVVAVAEPNDNRRKIFSDMYNIPEENQFTSWEELLEKGGFDSVLIANQDADHFQPIMKSIEKGYHILAEKPISNNLEEVKELLKVIPEYDKVFYICHVLRYTPFFQNIKKILKSGAIGDIISIQHNENVGIFHFCHSFVRGSWGNSNTSSPMVLAKSCHDMDILNYLIDKECKNVSSFGSLTHFKKENAPEGVPERCSDGCEIADTCPFSAYKYFEDDKEHFIPNFAEVVKLFAEKDDILEAIKISPYGRCVYHCDNNVVDHQIINMEYQDDVTVSFNLIGFTDKCGRTLKILGTGGELRAHEVNNEIIVVDYSTGLETVYNVPVSLTGHSGGDEGMIKHFVKSVNNPNYDEIKASNVQGLKAHLMSFAAEESRLEKSVVNMEEFSK